MGRRSLSCLRGWWSGAGRGAGWRSRWKSWRGDRGRFGRSGRSAWCAVFDVILSRSRAGEGRRPRHRIRRGVRGGDPIGPCGTAARMSCLLRWGRTARAECAKRACGFAGWAPDTAMAGFGSVPVGAHDPGVDGDDPAEVVLGVCLRKRSGGDLFSGVVDQCRDASDRGVVGSENSRCRRAHRTFSVTEAPVGGRRSMDPPANIEHKVHTDLSPGALRWSRLTVLSHGGTPGDKRRSMGPAFWTASGRVSRAGLGVINSWSSRGTWCAGSIRSPDRFPGCSHSSATVGMPYAGGGGFLRGNSTVGGLPMGGTVRGRGPSAGGETV